MSRGQSTDNSVTNPDKEHLLQLTEYTDDALWMFTPDWDTLIHVNSAYEDIFGQPRVSLHDDPTSFVEAVHPDDRGKVTKRMEELSAGNQIDVEFRVNPDEDYSTWVWVQGQPVFDEAGEVTYLAGYTRDITEYKRYQRQLESYKDDLERSNESLREFAYIASHDLQEPLRMVSSYVDLLDQEYGDQLDGEAQEYMDYAVNGARRMKRMINSLLDYSRIHTEADEFVTTDANEVMEAVVQDLGILIEEHDATVTVGDLPTLMADRDQLGQVFQNLVKNAIEHASDEGSPQVEVTGEERNGSYEFAVSDNGPGVPADEQDQIFQIFKKGTSPSDSGNTGIGLAIAQRIVHRHGGEIWVESDDTGATFAFTIPTQANPTTQEIEQ